MKYPKITIVYDRRHVASQAHNGSVEICVTYAQKRTFIGTGVRVKKNEWNKAGFVCRRADAEDLNDMMNARLKDVRDRVNELWKLNRFTIDALKAYMTQGRAIVTPLEWIAKRIEERPIRESTKRQHRTALKFWERCGLFGTWEGIDLAAIEKYDAMVRKGVSESTRYNYHKRLKIYLADAVRHGMLQSSPYNIYKVKRFDDVTTIKFLTVEEVEMLKAAKVGEVLDRVRDLWLFSFYTGFSYAELAAFDAAKIVKNGRRHYYEAHRLKTGAPVKCLIVSEARALLAKYNGVLPVISNQRYNGYLKLLATAAGIEKNLTSHMARHSFATFALSKGVPRDVIAVMLGHTGTREVDRYAKRLQEDVDVQYMKLEKAFKSK